MQLQEVRAIVTGAASGIGRRCALELVRFGAEVVAVDLAEDGLKSLSHDCDGLPGRMMYQRLDVAQEASVTEFMEATFRAIGSVNVLINSAGVLQDGLLASAERDWVKKLPVAQWRRVIDVNLTGAFLMTRETVAGMLATDVRRGVVINLSSLVRTGNAGQSAYSASKAGLDAATRSWAMELASKGIRFVSIAPGMVDTKMLDSISANAKARLLAAVPLGRLATTDEIWSAARFAIECDYLTGTVIQVDGGAIA